MTAPRQVPGNGRGTPWIAAVALLALPLAGCTSPLPPASPGDPALPSGAAAAPAPLLPAGLDAAPLPVARAAAEQAPPCHPVPERREEADVHRVIVTVQGCAAAALPVFGGTNVRSATTDFDVAEGAQHLLVLFQMQGSARIAAELGGPWPFEGVELEDQGTADRGSLIRYEIAQPPPGPWELRGWSRDLAAARTWTVTIVVTY